MDFFFPPVSAGALFRRRKLKRGDRGMFVWEDRLCADGLFGVATPSLCCSFGGHTTDTLAAPPLAMSAS